MISNTRLIFIATFFISLTFLSRLQSQGPVPSNNGTMDNYISLGDDIQMVATFDLRYEGVKGTPYMYEDWREGYVLFKDKPEDDPKTFKMNINLFDHTLYVVLYDGAIGSLPSKVVKSVHFKTDTEEEEIFMPLIRKQVESTNFPGLGYYQVVYKGDLLLVKHHRKIFKEADFKGAYSADIRYDEYKDEKRYFLSTDGLTFEKIKLKGKTLEKLIPDMATEIKSISKKEKLNLSKEEDVVKLLAALEKQS